MACSQASSLPGLPSRPVGEVVLIFPAAFAQTIRTTGVNIEPLRIVLAGTAIAEIASPCIFWHAVQVRTAPQVCRNTGRPRDQRVQAFSRGWEAATVGRE